jgi:hypothetical protein
MSSGLNWERARQRDLSRKPSIPRPNISRPASAAQRAFLTDLRKGFGMSTGDIQRMSRAAASREINKLVERRKPKQRRESEVARKEHEALDGEWAKAE